MGLNWLEHLITLTTSQWACEEREREGEGDEGAKKSNVGASCNKTTIQNIQRNQTEGTVCHDPLGFNTVGVVSRGMWGLNFRTEKFQKFL